MTPHELEGGDEHITRADPSPDCPTHNRRRRLVTTRTLPSIAATPASTVLVQDPQRTRPSTCPTARGSLRYSASMIAEDLRRLEAVGAHAEIPAGLVLIERGQYGAGVYLILEGTVVVEAPEGDLEFGPGAVMGERALVSPHGKRATRVRATTDLRVLTVDRGEFDQLCAQDPALAGRLIDAGA